MLAELLHLLETVAKTLGRALFVEPLDGTMHQQVRITADRRREMRIRAQRQTEVPDVARLITRLHHRAQHDGRDELLFWLTGHARENPVDLLRRKLVRRELVSEGAEEQHELFELSFVGP